VFIGASWVANSTKDLDQAWITKQQYAEHGSRIIESMNYNIR
jgi:actin-related protein